MGRSRRASDQGWTANVAAAVSREFGIPLDKPWKNLTPRQREVILFGAGEKRVKVTWNGKHGGGSWAMRFAGVVNTIKKRMQETSSEVMRQWYGRYFREQLCRACKGQRLRPESRAVLLAGKSLVDVTAMTVAGASNALRDARAQGRARPDRRPRSSRRSNARLGFLLDVGLEYLTLDRAAATLSGGEAQRIRLASQLGSELSGVMYVLDEPSIGLHQRDNLRLIATLRRLRDLGNSVIVVEHDAETIEAADHVVDFGPGRRAPGRARRRRRARPRQLKANPASLTGKFLAGTERIEVPATRRTPQGCITVKGAREHNLKNIDVAFPLGVLVAVTGVSGAGKSSLINGILQPALRRKLLGSYDQVGPPRAPSTASTPIDKVIDIDQKPIGRTPRSNPATYTKAFDAHPRGVRADRRGARLRLPARALLVQREGRPLRGVRGRRRAPGRDALPARRLRHLRGLPRQALQRSDAAGEVEGPQHRRGAGDQRRRGAGAVRAPPRAARHPADAGRRRLGYIALGPVGDDAVGRRGPADQAVARARQARHRQDAYLLDEPTTGLHFEDVRKLLARARPPGRRRATPCW